MTLHRLGFLSFLSVLLFRFGNLHPDQGLCHENLDSFKHLSENLKSFYLVLNQGITLCVASQAHGITKILKSSEMVLPSEIDLTEVVETEEIVEWFLSSEGNLVIYLLVDILPQLLFVLLCSSLLGKGRNLKVECGEHLLK